MSELGMTPTETRSSDQGSATRLGQVLEMGCLKSQQMRKTFTSTSPAQLTQGMGMGRRAFMVCMMPFLSASQSRRAKCGRNARPTRCQPQLLAAMMMMSRGAAGYQGLGAASPAQQRCMLFTASGRTSAQQRALDGQTSTIWPLPLIGKCGAKWRMRIARPAGRHGGSTTTPSGISLALSKSATNALQSLQQRKQQGAQKRLRLRSRNDRQRRLRGLPGQQPMRRQTGSRHQRRSLRRRVRSRSRRRLKFSFAWHATSASRAKSS
mmetsp:Transcript_26001/g.70446  ORF Transcript_26001/g.70446 Transcript_26001/m.70446 type:complete len:265 (+) Transcript_26001:1118-1912(+)